MISNTCLAMVPLIVPSATSFSSSAASSGEIGRRRDRLAGRLSAPNSSATVQLAPAWARRRRPASRVEPARGLDLGGQDAGVVGLDAQPFVPLALGVGQLGQRSAAFLEEGLVQLERQQVRVGEVAIIVRIFLRAEGPRDVLVGVVEPRFLGDLAALLDQLDLAARLMLDHRHDEADRVDVLGLGPGAKLARPACAR